MEEFHKYPYFKSILKKKHVKRYFLLFIIFLTFSILTSIFFYNDYILFILLFFTCFLLFLTISNYKSYHIVYRFVEKLDLHKVLYQVKDILLEVYQDSLELNAIYSSYKAKIPISSKKILAKAIIAENYAVIFFSYKELGIYPKIAKPILLCFGGGDRDKFIDSGGLEIVKKDNLIISEKDLIIKFPNNRHHSFKIIKLYNYLSICG